MSRQTPTRCDCPHLKPGQDPDKGGDWVAAWNAKPCTCCVHMRRAHWSAQRCEPVCILERFPIQLAAAWELTWGVFKRHDTAIVGPMGGSIQSDYLFDISDFVTYAEKIIGLPRRRWEPLMTRVKQMHAWWTRHKEGKFSFDAKDFAELQEIGIPIDLLVDPDGRSQEAD